MKFIFMIVSAIFVNNIILAKYLGNCPFLGVSQKRDSAIGMALAVVFVLTMSSIVTWIFQKAFLEPLNLVHLQTVVFILVIAGFVQLTEFYVRKNLKNLYQALGIFLPLITTNCAVLGVAILCIRSSYNFIETAIFAFSSSVGYGLAITLFSGIRERYEICHIPRIFKGTAIAMVSVGLMALAFLGFKGMA
ncbi:electron transport complex subunit RsxA [candidate division KSB1 bacterium]|nr:MAG: electron transport complex subunit RsxA [candidate division KSB1 bacterium]